MVYMYTVQNCVWSTCTYNIIVHCVVITSILDITVHCTSILDITVHCVVITVVDISYIQLLYSI